MTTDRTDNEPSAALDKLVDALDATRKHIGSFRGRIAGVRSNWDDIRDSLNDVNAAALAADEIFEQEKEA